ncbi:MAG: CRISPR-associated endonuclease Cas2 [Bacteroidota bacterium]
MTPPATIYMLMYDITHERTLQRAAKLIQKNGYERINFSVWLGWQGPKENPELFKILREMLNKPEASGSRLFFMPLGINSLKKIRSISGHKPSELDYWTGERRIQFF